MHLGDYVMLVAEINISWEDINVISKNSCTVL